MTKHNFHIFLIGNNSIYLNNSLKYIKKFIPYFRSINIVTNKIKKLGEFPIYSLPKIDFTNYDLTILELIKKLQEDRKIIKIMYLFEGEFLSGKIMESFNSHSKQIIFPLKIDNYLTWSMRVLDLRDSYILSNERICVVNGEQNTLYVEKNLFINSNCVINKKKGDSYISKLIQEGELYQAKKQLQTKLINIYSPEKKARLLLMYGYILSHLNAKIENIMYYLSLSFKLYPCFEPLYLLLLVGVYYKCEKKILLRTNKMFYQSLDISNYPQKSLLLYKYELYQYVYLYLLIKVAFKHNYYSLAKDSIRKILTINSIPKRIKSECILIQHNIENILSFVYDLKEIKLVENDINCNINISLTKPKNIIVIHERFSDIDIIMKNNLGNEQLQLLGLKLDLQNMKKDYKYTLFMEPIDQIISLLTIKNEKGVELYIDLPIVFYQLDISINEIKLYKQKKYIFGLYILNSKKNTLELNIPIVEIKKCHEYVNIIFIGNGGYKDYLYLHYFYLNGCHVYYHGKIDIYLDMINHYNNDFITNISFWQSEEIKKILVNEKNLQRNDRLISQLSEKSRWIYLLNQKIVYQDNIFLLDSVNYSGIEFSPNIIINSDNFINILKKIMSCNPINREKIYLQTNGKFNYYKVNFITKITNEINYQFIAIKRNTFKNKKMNMKMIINSKTWSYKTINDFDFNNYEVFIFDNVSSVKSLIGLLESKMDISKYLLAFTF